MRSFLPGLPLLFLVSALAGQSNAERMVTDPYSRSHDYDLVHQRIELAGFDWDSLRFTGRVGVTLVALRPHFDSVVLDAGAQLEILDVRSPQRLGVRPAVRRAAGAWRFAHTRDTLVVHLPAPAGYGDTVRFAISYRGLVANGRGLTFIEGDTAEPFRPRQLWSQGEADDNHLWFPTYDFPNDKMTWELIATVPRAFTVVSNGRLALDRINRDGTRTMHWRQERATASYLVSLVVAPLVRLADRWRGVPVDYYVYRQDTARARRLFAVTPDMMEVYSRLTGIRYPWAKYAQTTVADFFGGMENVSAVTLVDWLPDARAYADRPWYQHRLIPHELGHQWFGNYVTTANWANMWLNEGFAEFLPGQYWAEKSGRLAEDDYYLEEYDRFLGADARRRMPLASLGSNNIYPKGALVLVMLKKHLGPERFWAGVRRYLEDHADGVATSDDLRQAFLRATGENLAWFWDQWVYQAGYPEFDVTARWDSVTSLATVTVRQVQRDTLPPDSTGLRYRVPEVFRMPVALRLGTAAGDVTARVELTEREQVIHVGGVSSAPTMVIFDDGNAILKRLSFPQPTVWLAAQLVRDPDLWNRTWIIGQLARRREDAGALAALLHAATNADYSLIRAEAARALAGFEGPGVSAALQEALRDTSARVRAAAVAALGGSPEALAAVRRTWERDSSYGVRAAALQSLVRLEPASARALILQGLATPSYQYGIQDAALAAALEIGDTSLIDDVSRAVATTPNAGFVLGAFGTHGSARALDLLGSHVLAERAVVRRRALEAFRFAVPSSFARQRLTVLLARAPNERVRGEIRATLDRLTP
jgi:aminopeptidase N